MLEQFSIVEAVNCADLLNNNLEIQNTSIWELNEDQVFLAEIIVNIFMIQDSNSHPVFRLDTDVSKNQVGLETIGNLIHSKRKSLIYVILPWISGGAGGNTGCFTLCCFSPFLALLFSFGPGHSATDFRRGRRDHKVLYSSLLH